MRRLNLMILASALVCANGTLADDAVDPHGPTRVASRRFRPVLAKDGTLLGLFVHTTESDRKAVAVVSSTDDGHTWSEPRVLEKLPKTDVNDAWADLNPLIDFRNENLNLFLLKWENHDQRFPAKKLGAWHMMAEPPYEEWSEPKNIFDGYIGALMSTDQLKNGTMLLPFAYQTDRSFRKASAGLTGYVYMGKHTSTAIYSTDGKTFHKSPSDLNVPTPNLATYGAVEPVCLALEDGSAWMLIRTQMGRQWESFSKDGITWSEPNPSRFISSDSPVSLTRIRDGRIVIIWNNCLRYPYAYGGRHVLHAAVSDDEGATWRGFREIFRDPRRNGPAHPITGDYGTAYSFTAPTRDGKMIFSTGQGPTAGAFLLDPDWLTETDQREDFRDGLKAWSAFGVKGVELVALPGDPAKKALRIERVDKDFPAAAVWNFPNGRQGVVRVRFRLLPGPTPTAITLADHFSTPFDKEAERNGLFSLNLVEGELLPGGKRLRAGETHELGLNWDFDERACQVSLDGEPWKEAPQRKLDSEGASYLRFHVLSDEPARGGLLIESITADVAPAH